MFVKHLDSGKTSVLIVYVDDIILTGDDLDEMNPLKKNLATEFEFKDLEALKYFLRMEDARSRKVIMVKKMHPRSP